MIGGLQFLDKDGLGVLDVAEGDGAVAEVALADLCVDDMVNQFANVLLGIFGQRAGGGLH